MYSRILVPLDGSELAEQALPYARLLAKGLKIPIELLRVAEPVNLEVTDSRQRRQLAQIASDMRARHGEYLEKIAGSFASDKLQVLTEVYEGDPASQILSHAEGDPGTLIAMSTHGRSGIARWVFGSVMDKVLHAATNPMLVIRPQEDGVAPQSVKLTTLIVPLDGSPVGEQVIPHAVALSKGLRMKVVLARSTPSPEEYSRTMEYHYEVTPGPTIVKVYEGPVEEFSKARNAEAMEYLHGKVQDLRRQKLPSVREELMEGHPASAIVDLSRETEGSLIAMTTHGRSGVGRWVLGSVAARVVRHSESPVLVIPVAK